VGMGGSGHEMTSPQPCEHPKQAENAPGDMLAHSREVSAILRFQADPVGLQVESV